MSILASKKALGLIAEHIGEIRIEIDALKRANRSLELEFTELYDKVRHQMSRMAKRNAVDAREVGNGPDAEPPEVDPNAPDQISAAILARRGMRRPPT